MRILIIIPALNEAECIGGVIRELREHVPESDLLVIDDGSTDETAELARAAGARVVSLPYNMGVGTALRTGFRFAARHGYDAVIQTDADGQHDARAIHKIRAELEQGSDLVIGSRFAAADGHYSVDRTRGLAMGLLRVTLRALTALDLSDSTSGFRGFSRPLVRQFSTSYPREFLSDTVEALLMASYDGYRIAEVPVQMRHRQGGQPSHRSFRLGYHYIRVLVVMVLTMSTRGRRAVRRRAVQS